MTDYEDMPFPIMPGIQFQHVCVRCGEKFVSNIRQQFFCMGCRPPVFKGKLGSKIDGWGNKITGRQVA